MHCDSLLLDFGKSVISDTEIEKPKPCLFVWANILKDRTKKKHKKRNVEYLYLLNFESKRFLTGSRYYGLRNALGMQGAGDYTLPHHVIYRGKHDNGVFHGKGTLTYPNSAKFVGKWVRGTMTYEKYYFSDDVPYTEEYCKTPDRRYILEHNTSVHPAGRSILTNNLISREIPVGCYDTGDGFYDPVTKCVHHPEDRTKIIRIPTRKEHDWICENCRKGWDEVVGYRPDLYENWFEENQAEICDPIKLRKQ